MTDDRHQGTRGFACSSSTCTVKNGSAAEKSGENRAEDGTHVCLSQGQLKVGFLFNMTKRRVKGRCCRGGEVEKTKGGKLLVNYTVTRLILVQKNHPNLPKAAL